MRGLARRLPVIGRRRRDEGRSAASSTGSQPSLTVVVHLRGSETHLDECLDSLRAQTLRDLEIVVIDIGARPPPPSVLAAVEAVAPRVVISAHRGAGPGAARNAGVALARGRYLTFANPEDTVPATAYANLVAALDRSGSDFAGGAVTRDRNGRSSTPAWSATAYRAARTGTTIDQHPAALLDLFAGGKVFRREFWVRSVGPYAEDIDTDDTVPGEFWNERMGPYEDGVAYLDHLPLVKAYLRARSFDVLTSPAYVWRVLQRRERAAPSAAELGRRRMVLRQARELVDAGGSARCLAAWTSRVLSVEAPVLVRQALAADDDFRSAVGEVAAAHLYPIDAAALATTPVDRKLLAALAAERRWPEVEDLLEAVRLDGPLPPTIVRQGRIYADPSRWPGGDLPGAIRELALDQSRMSAVVSRVSWDTEATLHIEGWCLIRGIDLEDREHSLVLSLREMGGSRVVAVQVEPRPMPEATRWANGPHQRYDRAGFHAAVSAAAIPGPVAAKGGGGGRTRWQLWAAASAAGVRRSGAVEAMTRFGTSDRLPSSPVIDPADPARAVCLFSADEGLVVEVRHDAVRAVSLAVAADGALTGRLRVLTAMDGAPSQAALFEPRQIVSEPLTALADGTLGFQLKVPAGAATPHLRVVTDTGQSYRVGWPDDRSTPPRLRSGEWVAGWQRSPRGNVGVVMPRPRAQVESVDLNEDLLTLEVTTEQLTGRDLERCTLATSHTTVAAASVAEVSPSRWSLSFPVRVPAWPAGALCGLPSGRYDLAIAGDGVEVPLTAGVELIGQLPLEALSGRHAMTVTRAPRSTRILLTFGAPLREGERARADQQRLRDGYQRTGFQPANQVYFQCYRGEFATDSQLAIHRELRRRDTDLDLVWGIADSSVELPPGARGVIIGSRGWYEALGRSRYLCSNIDLDRFFRRRDHQRFLQTFHGYPFKSMGVSFWRSKGFSEYAIEQECERRRRAWTSILVPARFCEALYRESYRYQGEVLITGYPRDDDLARPDPTTRARVLGRVGVDPGHTVVLYAPTWREPDAITARTARFYDQLDLARLTEALGADHTVLVRGHVRTIGHTSRAPARPEIVDVTRYPEVNDLILAADVAVLDYSSLRFDWLLTGKPVLFFVPDLEDYLAQRSALFDFEPTAPGPLLVTTDQVIEAIRAIDSVSAAYAAPRDEFNARFNGLHDGHAATRVVSAFFDADDS